MSRFAELALFSVLFTDGMRLGASDLRFAWRLPGRALLLGFPLTLAGNGVLAHYLAGLGWRGAFLVGAVLTPTDPVFAAAIVGREEVPRRLRHLLNVESGVNDGLALPFVVVLLAVAARDRIEGWRIVEQLVVGVAIGVVVPVLAVLPLRVPVLKAAGRFRPLHAFAIGLIILSVTALTHSNEFLGAFAGGATVATVSPETREAFGRFGELVTELLKLAALLLFGALVTPSLLSGIGWRGYVFAAAILVVVRPAAIGMALLGSSLNRRERVVAGWFGPKGFASVVYGLLIVSRSPAERQLFALTAVSVAVSILAHSSTDVLVARWFRIEEADDARGGDDKAATAGADAASSGQADLRSGPRRGPGPPTR
jgi:NhaP-type Na+/H+ or K+/H+ antiporter